MKTDGKYRLEGHTPVACEDLLEWAQSFESSERRVAQTDIKDGVRVSTVFLGMDHNFGSDGPPLLFETMIFGGPHDGYQVRYPTWDEAERGHEEAVSMAAGDDR